MFRTVFFMPNLIGDILLGFAWQFVFTQGFNYGKSLKLHFLVPGMVVYTIYIYRWINDCSCLWQAGYMMIVYIAQLQSIPDNLIEAAEIDGAGRLQRFKRI